MVLYHPGHLAVSVNSTFRTLVHHLIKTFIDLITFFGKIDISNTSHFKPVNMVPVHYDGCDGTWRIHLGFLLYCIYIQIKAVILFSVPHYASWGKLGGIPEISSFIDNVVTHCLTAAKECGGLPGTVKKRPVLSEFRFLCIQVKGTS